MPSAFVYEGANGGAVTFDGGATPQIVYILTQRLSLPSANNTACGVDQLSVFFYVNRAINVTQILTWSQLTNGEYAPAGELVEGNGAVRCDVSIGYEGGPQAQDTQLPVDNTVNGFNAYGEVTFLGHV